MDKREFKKIFKKNKKTQVTKPEIFYWKKDIFKIQYLEVP